MNFLIGILLGYFFSYLLDKIAEQDQWEKMTTEDFKHKQEEEMKKFLQFKFDAFDEFVENNTDKEEE